MNAQFLLLHDRPFHQSAISLYHTPHKKIMCKYLQFSKRATARIRDLQQSICTVEPPIMDTPNKGGIIRKNLSIKDTPRLLCTTPVYCNLQREDDFSMKDKMAGPKCVNYSAVPPTFKKPNSIIIPHSKFYIQKAKHLCLPSHHIHSSDKINKCILDT